MVSLNLSHNLLIGPLPRTLGCLTNLTLLSLASNQINGSIPLEIGNMRKLRHLDLHNNSLAGLIPSTIGCLTELVFLDFSVNNLVGSIPPYLGHSTNLRYLDIHSNQINGSINSTIADLLLLEKLDLSSNYIFGIIPLELSQLTQLRYLNISLNKLSGNGFSLKAISVLDLSHNNLSELYWISHKLEVHQWWNESSKKEKRRCKTCVSIHWIKLQCSVLYIGRIVAGKGKQK